MILVRTSHLTFMYVINEPEAHVLVNLFIHQNKLIFLEGLVAGLDPLFLDIRLQLFKTVLEEIKYNFSICCIC